MKQDDFEEYINKLQNKKFVTSRRASLIIGNFYSLITIVIISVCIIIYTNYVVPAQEAANQKKQENEKTYINN